MKNEYPLDEEGIHRIFNQFLEHSRAQVELVARLTDYLRESMTYVDEEDEESEWYQEAEALVQEMHQRKMDFDNFRFDQKNGHKADHLSPYQQGAAVSNLPAGQPLTPDREQVLNKLEESFGEPMSVEELARHFGEPLPKKPKKEKAIKNMSLEEIKDWEARQDNSSDIYKVAARMKNAARAAVNGNLTSQGVMVVNTFAHMVKAFYDFTLTIHDPETRIRLTELTRKQEDLPANLIKALWAGVKNTKEEEEQ